MADVGDGTRPYGGLWERAWLTDTKECYERRRRRGTCFHFVSNVKSRARGRDDDRELRGSPEPCLLSFVLKMCEFMVLPCRPHNIFKMADDIPVHLSPHGERRQTEREGSARGTDKFSPSFCLPFEITLRCHERCLPPSSRLSPLPSHLFQFLPNFAGVARIFLEAKEGE